ncbi:hypothetical protein PENTCL1PPCAC_10950, partial [Pristionchus entomophagus]
MDADLSRLALSDEREKVSEPKNIPQIVKQLEILDDPFIQTRTTSEGIEFTLTRTVKKNPNGTISSIVTQTLFARIGESLDAETQFNLLTKSNEKFVLNGVAQASVYLSTTSGGTHTLYKAEMMNGLLVVKEINKIPTKGTELLITPHYICPEINTNLHSVHSYEGEIQFEGIDLHCLDDADYSVVVTKKKLTIFILNHTLRPIINASLVLCASGVEYTDLFVDSATSCVYIFTRISEGRYNILKVDLDKSTTWILKSEDAFDEIFSVDKVSDTAIVLKNEGMTTRINNPEWTTSSQFISFEANGALYSIYDEYDQLEFLGKGGFGIVVKGINKRDLYTYAIKIIELKKDNTYEKAIREVRSMIRFNHPGIIHAYKPFIRNVAHNFRSQLLSEWPKEQEEEDEGSSQNQEEPEPYRCLIVPLEVCACSMEDWLKGRVLKEEELGT